MTKTAACKNIPVKTTLPDSFVAYGHYYTKARSNDKAALYSLSNAASEGYCMGYEVWKIRKGLRLPSPSDWGRYGWSYTSDNYSEALKKYKEIS